MTLQFRGQSYQIADSTQQHPPEMLEGQYHGIKTAIALPIETPPSPFAHLLIYRGVKLAG